MAAVVLTSQGEGPGPRLTRATFLPERGLMLSQLSAVLPGRGEFDLVADAPPGLETDDFVGNASFAYGGAFLIPYANRIRGRPGPNRTISAEIGVRPVTLPANWSGKASGSEPYAMHGLILDQPVEIAAQSADRLLGRLQAADFGGRWMSAAELTFDLRLAPGALVVRVDARNVGAERAPVGIGWHPYFQLPSGDRRQARLHVAARDRLEVGDYDAVLPTGAVLPLAGSPYDFTEEAGRPLGDLYLDDCFVHLRPAGDVVARLVDPAADLELTLTAKAPVQAVQVYAPPDKPFVVIEPQFNWADPFGAVWPTGTDTGMVWLEPGENIAYAVELRLGKTR